MSEDAQTETIEAGDLVRIKPFALLHAEPTKKLRDDSAIGQVVYRDDQRGTIFVRFADRQSTDRFEPGHSCYALWADLWELVNISELPSNLDNVDREDWKRYSAGIFARENPPALPDELAALKARVQELEAALTPFAEAGETWSKGNPHNPLQVGVWSENGGQWVYTPIVCGTMELLRVSHLRAAADALKAGKP